MFLLCLSHVCVSIYLLCKVLYYIRFSTAHDPNLDAHTLIENAKTSIALYKQTQPNRISIMFMVSIQRCLSVPIKDQNARCVRE